MLVLNTATPDVRVSHVMMLMEILMWFQFVKGILTKQIKECDGQRSTKKVK